jgi:hypothetical protein
MRVGLVYVSPLMKGVSEMEMEKLRVLKNVPY